MGFIRWICRILFGLVFIASGFLKLIDPVGTSLQVAEYLHIMHLDLFSSLSVLMGIGLSVVEFTIGVSVLLSAKMKIVAWGALGMMIFFTPLTLYLAIFNPISDCGCFGEAIHFTNWGTFFKNIVLSAFAIVIFINRRLYVPIANSISEWAIVAVSGTIALFISVFSYRNTPIIDFTEFKAGTNLTRYLEENRVFPDYKTTSIYEKEGERIEVDFERDDAPDSSWSYVETISEIISQGDGLKMDFSIRDAEGNYVTRDILSLERSFISVINDLSSINKREWGKIKRFADTVQAHGGEFLIVAASYPQEVEEAVSEYEIEIPVYYGDYKTLITLSRSNGGVIYLYEGVIVNKWSWRHLPSRDVDRIMNSVDYDLLITKVLINERLSFEVLIASLLLVAILLRLIMKGSKNYKIRATILQRARSIRRMRRKIDS